MSTILSTKKLNSTQKDILVSQGFTVVDYDAIDIKPIDFKVPDQIENAIFTSQNGVRSIQNSEFRIQNCYCVGQKTKALLEQNGLKVIENGENSAELGEIIAKKHKNKVFHYFCGVQRREELPNLLKASKIDVFEVKTYKTTLKPVKFDQKWDKILFFSPSGVESYFAANCDRVKAIPQQVRNDSPLLICIGETTAEAARTYTSKVVIAEKTSVESVIKKTINSL